MAWSYDEAYVGMQPNFKRLCPFCGGRDVTFDKPKYSSFYTFRCWNPACGATVHFEVRDALPRPTSTPAGASGSVHRWNRRCPDAQ